MKKNIAMVSKVSGIGLASVLSFGASGVMAAPFDATASVQNALAITVGQPMNFGELFAASANASAVARLVLAPTGGIAPETALPIDGVAADAPSFLSLGGAPAAAQGTVSPSNNAFTITVPAGTNSDLAASSDFATTDQEVLDGKVVEMTIGSGQASIARFYLADFKLASISGTDSFAVDVDPTKANVYNVQPTYNSDVVFAVGASIFTDGSGTRTTYQQGTYTGTFEVEASF